MKSSSLQNILSKLMPQKCFMTFAPVPNNIYNFYGRNLQVFEKS
jgi:hypothetical protein